MIFAFLSQHPPRTVVCAPELSPVPSGIMAQQVGTPAAVEGLAHLRCETGYLNLPPNTLRSDLAQGPDTHSRKASIRAEKGAVPFAGPLIEEVQVSTGEAA